MSLAARSLGRVAAAGLARRCRFALSVGLGLGTVVAGLGLLATSGYLISKAALEPPIMTLTVAIVGVRFFGVSRAILRYFERLVSHDLAFRVLADLRVSFYRRLIPVAQTVRGGDLLSRFVGDVDSLQNLLVRGLAPPLIGLGAGAVAVGVAAAIYLPAALVLATGLAIAATAVPLLGTLAWRTDAGAARAALTGELIELLDGAPELVVYGQGHAHAGRVRRADRALARLARRDALVSGLTDATLTFVVYATTALCVAIAIPAVTGGDLNGVYLAVLALLALGAHEAVAGLPAAVQQLKGSAVAAARLERVTTGTGPLDPPSPRRLDGPCVLRLEDAAVRYEPATTWALDGVDLELRPGRRVALVGPVGSGKTTLAHTLVRFQDVDRGRVSIDGHAIREYAQRDVRNAVLLAAQDAYLFATSIAENVRLARPSASDAEIEDALRRAGAWTWVRTLAEGTNTLVGENGALVSGGQRQRIALARALLAEPKILVLDEPTAHLDDTAASAFTEQLLDAADGIGLLLITHRLHGLDRFDEVVVLEHGKVVRRSAPRELAA